MGHVFVFVRKRDVVDFLIKFFELGFDVVEEEETERVRIVGDSF